MSLEHADPVGPLDLAERCVRFEPKRLPNRNRVVVRSRSRRFAARPPVGARGPRLLADQDVGPSACPAGFDLGELAARGSFGSGERLGSRSRAPLEGVGFAERFAYRGACPPGRPQETTPAGGGDRTNGGKKRRTHRGTPLRLA